MNVPHPTVKSKVARAVWNIVWLLLYRPTPTFMHAWRRALLVLFGAQIGQPAYVYPSARIWAPWNLRMGRHSTLASDVDCYCVERVTLGDFTTVSQYSYLCTASHDYQAPLNTASALMPLKALPIFLGDRVWLTAGVFVGPGVTIGDGTVVLARSVVTQDLPGWSVVSGHPAIVRRLRKIRAN